MEQSISFYRFLYSLRANLHSSYYFASGFTVITVQRKRGCGLAEEQNIVLQWSNNVNFYGLHLSGVSNRYVKQFSVL